MRCAKCGEIWFCTRDDLVEPQPEPPVNKAEGTDVPAETEVSAVPAEGSPAEPEDETASEPAPETAVMNDILPASRPRLRICSGRNKPVRPPAACSAA